LDHGHAKKCSLETPGTQCGFRRKHPLFGGPVPPLRSPASDRGPRSESRSGSSSSGPCAHRNRYSLRHFSLGAGPGHRAHRAPPHPGRQKNWRKKGERGAGGSLRVFGFGRPGHRSKPGKNFGPFCAGRRDRKFNRMGSGISRKPCGRSSLRSRGGRRSLGPGDLGPRSHPPLGRARSRLAQRRALPLPHHRACGNLSCRRNFPGPL